MTTGKKYYLLKTSNGAVVSVYELGSSSVYYWDENGATNKELIDYLNQVESENFEKICRYQSDRGAPWNPYPYGRAAIEFLQEAGALMFDGEKIEVEDVGPPYDDAGNDDSGAFRFDDGFEIAY